MNQHASIGVDVGGTTIKAGLVDLGTGKLIGEAVHTPTPRGGAPLHVLDAITGCVQTLDPTGEYQQIGVCLPSVVRKGVTLTAANMDPSWIGFNAADHLSSKLQRTVVAINDADAAGYAETRYGAARGEDGLVILVTLGTGVGTALIHDGTLVPNSELGHLEIEGIDWETKAASVARERLGLSWVAWADNLQIYLDTLERLTFPDLIVIGGGISSTPERFLPLIRCTAPVVAAELGFAAGIGGAAALSAIWQRERSTSTTSPALSR